MFYRKFYRKLWFCNSTLYIFYCMPFLQIFAVKTNTFFSNSIKPAWQSYSENCSFALLKVWGFFRMNIKTYISIRNIDNCLALLEQYVLKKKISTACSAKFFTKKVLKVLYFTYYEDKWTTETDKVWNYFRVGVSYLLIVASI